MRRGLLLADSTVLEISPKPADSQVTAKATAVSSPAAASHSRGVAPERKPRARATPTTRTAQAMVWTTLPRTCPVMNEARVMSMVRNRLMMPSVMSEQMAIEVDIDPAATPMMITPGVRYSR